MASSSASLTARNDYGMSYEEEKNILALKIINGRFVRVSAAALNPKGMLTFLIFLIFNFLELLKYF